MELVQDQQEQRQHEGLAGWEGTAALGELAADAAGAGAAETGLAAAADAAEAEGAALLEETDAVAAAEGTRMAQEGTQTAGTVGGVSAAETAAASDDGLTSPAVVRPPEPLLPEGGGGTAEECQMVPESATSPSPLGTAEVAAVVVEAGRRQQLPPNEETAPPAAESAGTSAGAGGANMQGHGRAGSGRPVPGTGVASCAARGKKLRAQPAPRRPGAGLGPGVPGPLLGWLLQGQSPQGPARPPPSHVEAAVATSTAQTTTQAAPTQAPGNQVRATNGAPAVTDTTAAAAGSNVAVEAVGTRRSARLGAITWGPPRGGRTPWMPAGRGGNGAAETAGAAGRGQRGVLRGGMRGGRGGRNQQPRSEIPVRTGPWRERHARPERAILQTNEGQEVSDNSGADPEFMVGEEETSEEISLEDEEAPRRRNNPEPQTGLATGGIPSNPAEGEAPATEETDVPSPADLAGDDAIWHMAGEWDVNVLQRGDQPFLVRRLPPHILDRYSYADDITIIGQREAACRAFTKIAGDLAEYGLRCNISKSSAWGAEHDGDNRELPLGLVADPGGIRVLGSPIGSDDFCTAQVRAALGEAASPLPLVSQLNPQHAMLIISRSISRRISYMLRTTPATTLGAEEWRDWSEALVGSALTAAKLRIPNSELEQSLLWRQATLPIRLGGLGIIDPVSVAPAAYIASVTAAHILLQHLNLPPDCLLHRATALLSHDWSPPPPDSSKLSSLEKGLPAQAQMAEDEYEEREAPARAA
ncbi:unnamed protein product [Closterium sp. NIES-65]|nr:unnamed protein product [Closterium sp. NIES-65]